MMMRWVSILTLLVATIGCADGSPGPSETAAETAPPEAFAGEWRSVTPSLEFIGLSVISKSSEQGVMGARLMFSGVYWEGSGRIEGDSLVANMTVVGATTASGVIVVHARDAQTLRVQFRSATAAPLELTFARED
jgi:hypothetical protein